MGPFKVHIHPNDSDPKNNPSVVDIGRSLDWYWFLQNFSGLQTTVDSALQLAQHGKRLVDCIGIKENKLDAFVPTRVVVKKGIIWGIPLDISTEDLLEKIRAENPSIHITCARRLQNLQKNVPARGTGAEWNSERQKKAMAWVDSKSQLLPNEAVAWNAILMITPFIPVIKLCY
jgi:hypothetical protein